MKSKGRGESALLRPSASIDCLIVFAGLGVSLAPRRLCVLV